MSRSRIKVLLAEGSSLSARHTVRALAAAEADYQIDLIDPNPFCLARLSRHVDKYFRCPQFSREPEAYLKQLFQLLEDQAYDVLLPTHEQVVLLSRFRKPLQRRVGLALPHFNAMEAAVSKVSFARLLDQLNLPQPPMRIVRRRDELLQHDAFPCYVKLPHSTAGQGVFAVADHDALVACADRLHAKGMLAGGLEILLQQPARGCQATVQAVFRDGELVDGHMFEARHVGVAGMSSARVSVAHPNVMEHVETFGRRLQWHGAMFLDYFYDGERGPQFLECNPRIGETMNAVFSGVNLCESLIRVSLDRGEAVAPKSPARLGVRSHSGFMLAITEAVQSGSRRGLLSLRRRARRAECELFRDSLDELTDVDDWSSRIPEWVINLQLLIRPQAGRKIVNRTVNDYAVDDQGVDRIRTLPLDLIGPNDDCDDELEPPLLANSEKAAELVRSEQRTRN